ncbi:hypothetical protein A6R68_17378, partial [Neotoma lepida]
PSPQNLRSGELQQGLAAVFTERYGEVLGLLPKIQIPSQLASAWKAEKEEDISEHQEWRQLVEWLVGGHLNPKLGSANCPTREHIMDPTKVWVQEQNVQSGRSFVEEPARVKREHIPHPSLPHPPLFSRRYPCESHGFLRLQAAAQPRICKMNRYWLQTDSEDRGRSWRVDAGDEGPGLFFKMKEEDILKFLVKGTRLGGTKIEQYIYKRKTRAIIAFENPADVSVISSRNTGQRAVLKFAAATGATPIDAHFMPGTFTNQTQAAFRDS